MNQVRSNSEEAWNAHHLFIMRKLDVLCQDDWADYDTVLHANFLIKQHYREYFNYKRRKRDQVIYLDSDDERQAKKERKEEISQNRFSRWRRRRTAKQFDTDDLVELQDEKQLAGAMMAEEFFAKKVNSSSSSQS